MNLFNDYEGDKNKGKLVMEFFEGLVVKDAVYVVFNSYYTLEGDIPLMLTATNVFKSIDKWCNDGFGTYSLEKAAEDNSIALKEIFASMMRQKNILQMDVEEKIAEVDLM